MGWRVPLAMMLDIEQPEQLLAYLRSHGRIRSGERVHTVRLHGGVSNRVVLVGREGGEEWVVKQALPKLRVKVDWFSSPERIRREALALRALSQLAPAGSVPRFLWEDQELHVLAMEAVPRPHDNWKELLLRDGAGLHHVAAFAHLLATIHTRAAEEHATVEPLFRDTTFFESLRLEPYYRYTATRVPEAARFLGALAEEALQTRSTLVHGDFSPKNVLVRRGKLVLLDYEVAHFGDPAFDLGFGLTHLLSKANHLEAARARFIDATHEFWNVYLDGVSNLGSGAELESRAVRHTLACLLARVEGRSTLEYLSEQARVRQRELTLSLIRRLPSSIPELIRAWSRALS